MGRIKDLPNTNTPGSEDRFAVDDSSTTRSITYNILAYNLLTSYGGVSLGGQPRPVKTAIDALSEKHTYTVVTDWDTFKPGTSREVKHGYSTGGTASGVPVTGDSITYYGWVEGVTANCTQHIYTMNTGTASNRNRYWLRQCINGSWGSWSEVTKNWWNQSTVTDLDTVTEPGIYSFASGAAGLPEGWGAVGGSVFVYGGPSYVYQLAFRNGASPAPNVYHRLKNTSGWGPWYFLDATGKSVQTAETRTGNIDLFPSYGVYGVWWINLNPSTSITGEKPYTSGQGVLMCLKQNAELVRQVYIPVISDQKLVSRYYNLSTGAWTEWSTSSFVSSVNSYTRTVSVGTGTKTSEIDISALSSDTVINAALTGDSVGSASLCRVNSIVIDKVRNKLRVETYNGESSSVTLTFTIYYV